MKKIKILQLLLSSLLLGCSFSKSNNDPILINKAIIKEEQKNGMSEFNFKVYKFSNSVFYQEIKIKQIEKDKIHFIFFVENNKFGCQRNIEGVAINRFIDFDPELDEDEEGFGYPSNQYVFENDSIHLQIRIAKTTLDKVQIFSLKDNDRNCSLKSQGILR